MSPIAAKVTAIEKRGDQYQVIIQISPKYRGSFNTLAFGTDLRRSAGVLIVDQVKAAVRLTGLIDGETRLRRKGQRGYPKSWSIQGSRLPNQGW